MVGCREWASSTLQAGKRLCCDGGGGTGARGQWTAAQQSVATTPAHTLAGVVAKLRQIESELHVSEKRAMAAAIADLKRLGGLP